MFIRSISLFLLCCSAAHAQQEWNAASRKADSLRGPVSTVEAFSRNHRVYEGASDGLLQLAWSARYDSAGNKIQYSSIYASREYCYDGTGRLACISKPGNRSIHYSYDERGNIAEENHRDPGEISYRVTYKYDSAGRVIEERCEYDEWDRIEVLIKSYGTNGLLAGEQEASEYRTPLPQDPQRRDNHIEKSITYSTPDTCIETPFGADCSCATIATVKKGYGENKEIKEQICYGTDGNVRWRRGFPRFSLRSFPIAEDFVLLDAKGRDSIIIRREAVPGEGRNYYTPPRTCTSPSPSMPDTTKWAAIFARYDQHDNYIGECLHIYEDLSDLRAGKSCWTRELTVGYTFDSHGNWIRQVRKFNGDIADEVVRVIEYHPHDETPEREAQQDLR